MTDIKETVDSWLKDIGAFAGVDLGFNEHGVCAMTFEDGLICRVEQPSGSGMVLFSSPRGQVPADREESGAYLKRLLCANRPGNTLDGAFFCIDDRDQVLLCRLVPVAGLDGTGFRNALGHFVETARRVDMMHAASGSSPDDTDAAGFNPHDGFVLRV